MTTVDIVGGAIRRIVSKKIAEARFPACLARNHIRIFAKTEKI